VGSFPKDVSWVGALDMTGNVSEIVLKKRSDNSWTVKGGDWRYGPYKICERDFYSWTSGVRLRNPITIWGFVVLQSIPKNNSHYPSVLGGYYANTLYPHIQP
jgi:hypothetical protein